MSEFDAIIGASYTVRELAEIYWLLRTLETRDKADVFR